MVDRLSDPVRDLLEHAKYLPVLQALTTALPYLSEAEAALVQFLLRNPEKVASMSAVEVAAAAGVSEATLYRLCRQLELGGYAPLRDQMREIGKRYEPDFVQPVNVRRPKDPQLTPLQWAAYFGLRTLLDACCVAQEELDRAASAIIKAPRVSVAGVGFLSAGLAHMTAVALQRLGVTCMSWTDPQSMRGVGPAVFQGGDALVAVSHSGETARLLEFVEAARQAGAVVIAVVNYRQSTLAQKADIGLITGVREYASELGDLLPRAAQLLVLQVLLNMIRDRLADPERRASTSAAAPASAGNTVASSSHGARPEP